MREVQFRGKTDDGRWAYGHYVKSEDIAYLAVDLARDAKNVHHFICIDEMISWNCPYDHSQIEVDPNTVGEWSGVLDKHKRRIYEGDIVKKRGRDGSFHNMSVRFRNGRFECWYRPKSPWIPYDYTYLLTDSKIEVVGNIYDNPELLQNEEKAP